ncbi:MAG: acyl-ACP--UDP-N-acetylglucosamine O-acyltransferase [Gammaproteobacteria bacterium]|jgi:UDP-N-acetylglucosamine acyltransferase|nr:acyl-ACP--UDP-N-acetylglucosamine O-acyltransferase [Gammaproteobacteria bacterium]
MNVHASALVDPQATLAEDVEVGPYSIIGPQVSIGAGTRIGAHVVLTGRTSIGEHNRIFQFCSLGEEPQDMKYAGEDTSLVIGNHNTIREYCTFNRGTLQGGGETLIGDHNWIMAYVHIAHDCRVGNRTVFANNASLAGHVSVDDWVILGGFSVVHQYCSIGQHSFLSFGSKINQSVPPYVVTGGDNARARGINSEGLRRRGFDSARIRLLKRAYTLLYRRDLPLEDTVAELQGLAGESADIQPIVDFLAQTQRSYIH